MSRVCQYGAFGVHGSHVTWTWWVLTMAGIVVVPFLVYWCWICVEYHKGDMFLPYRDTKDLTSWFHYVFGLIRSEAVPTWAAWRIYLTWTALQAVLAKFGPGHKQKGVVLQDGTRLEYTFNGQFAFFTTLIIAFYLHFTGSFRLTVLYDLFPQMLSVCIIWCSLVIGAIYIAARATGTIENQTDSILYDYFMGPQLNPHIGKGTYFSFDIKWSTRTARTSRSRLRTPRCRPRRFRMHAGAAALD